MPLPPPIRLLNTGYVEPPHDQRIQDVLIKDYNCEDPADGEPLISSETIAQEERASKAQAEDMEMVDAGEDANRLKPMDGVKPKSAGGRKKVALSSAANCSTTTRKQPGKTSRMSLRVDSASLQDGGRIGDAIYGLLNIEMDSSRSLLDREDPRDIPSLFRRHDRYYGCDAREEQPGLSSRHDEHAEDNGDHLPVVLEGYGEDTGVTPLEVADDSNMFQSGYMYHGEVQDDESGEPSEPYHAGVDYHSHAALLGDSNRTPAERRERAEVAAEMDTLKERARQHRLQRARERQHLEDRGRAQLRQMEVQAVQQNFARHAQLRALGQTQTPGTFQGQAQTEVGDHEPLEMQASRHADLESRDQAANQDSPHCVGQSGHLRGPFHPQAYQGVLSSDSQPSTQSFTSGPFATPGTAGVLPVREETGTKRKFQDKEKNPAFKGSQSKKLKVSGMPGSSFAKQNNHRKDRGGMGGDVSI
ncbi:uncharacterized protein N0V89_007009 [Didymosphaeria variabile]|uniref:Uncharacterized protein n=1 Tax=Didymosphaeria variabile TaxID=1932322 RepID=A0A9W8XK17_9PLEO|nr:uncharacterized protein N0V89_007009 [Didymosphaeria variabile]KAJ4351666.1 hypothetical protein N0V89_007009 [Didymosphaeria variabile]